LERALTSSLPMWQFLLRLRDDLAALQAQQQNGTEND
jgi:hypothetical protein